MKTVENKIFPSIMFVSCFLSHLYLCTLFSSARMRTFLGGWAGVCYRNSCFLSFLFTFFPIKEVKLSNSPIRQSSSYSSSQVCFHQCNKHISMWSCLYLGQGNNPS